MANRSLRQYSVQIDCLNSTITMRITLCMMFLLLAGCNSSPKYKHSLYVVRANPANDVVPLRIQFDEKFSEVFGLDCMWSGPFTSRDAIGYFHDSTLDLPAYTKFTRGDKSPAFFVIYQKICVDPLGAHPNDSLYIPASIGYINEDGRISVFNCQYL